MSGTDKMKFWEHDYASTTVNVEEVDESIRDAHVILDELKTLLFEKNKAYGNSALSDVNLFCNLSSIQLLQGQIEHKLRRLKALGVAGDTEDTLMDLLGYLTLFMVAVRRNAK
jgi:hypothetical protein